MDARSLPGLPRRPVAGGDPRDRVRDPGRRSQPPYGGGSGEGEDEPPDFAEILVWFAESFGWGPAEVMALTPRQVEIYRTGGKPGVVTGPQALRVAREIREKWGR